MERWGSVLVEEVEGGFAGLAGGAVASRDRDVRASECDAVFHGSGQTPIADGHRDRHFSEIRHAFLVDRTVFGSQVAKKRMIISF